MLLISYKILYNTLKFINTSEKDIKVFGIGCTGAIATNRNRKGEDRAHIAIKSKNKECIYSIYFNKLKRDRLSEEIIVSKQIINAIACISEIPDSIPLDLLEDEKFFETN